MDCKQEILKLRDTGERAIEPEDISGEINFLRHKVAYRFAEQFVGDKLVLDDGSGSGYGSYYLAAHGAKSVVGIDVAADAVEYASNRYNRENLAYKAMNSTELSFSDETFDVVTSFQVIEHIRETGKFLYEISRVLKKPGVALISTPNKQTSSPGSSVPENPFHVREFCQDEFYKLLKPYFKTVEILGVNRSTRMEKVEKSVNVQLIKRIEKAFAMPRLSFVARMIPKRLRTFLRGGGTDISDFIVAECAPDRSIDFIAICSKA